MQQFYQKRLGLPWREYVEDYKLEITRSGYRKGESWEETAGVDARGRIVAAPYTPGEVATQIVILTVDVQMDHFYAVVRAWSANGSSRLVWNERLLSWHDIDALQARFGIHANLVFLDAGHATYDVYRECSARGWIALIGDRRATFVHRSAKRRTVQRFYSPRRKVVLAQNRACFVHYWSNLNIKDTLARLRRNQDPERGATWEVPDDIDDDYLAQMESEQRIKEKGTWMWKQIGNRPNHYFDCEGMQAAAATMLKLIGRESVESSDVENAQSAEGGERC